MKRVVMLLAILAIVGFAWAQEARTPKFSIGLDLPTYAWVTSDEAGNVTKLTGINLALGFSYRSYFQPLAPQSGAGYWEAGTILLLDPYVGVGYDYRVNESLYVGGGLDVYPFHALMGGYGLVYTFVPNLHVGVYLF